MSRFPRWWFWAAVLVPAAITAIGLGIQSPGIERAVEASVHAAVPDATVRVYGRDVTIGGLRAERLSDAQTAAGNAAGVRQVSTIDPVLRPMKLVFHAGEVVVSGVTGKDEWRQRFIAALGAKAHGRTIVDDTKTVADTDFPITTLAAQAAVAIITQQSSDMTISVDAGQVTIAGVVPDANRRNAIVTVLRRLFGAATVVDQTKTKE
jgi:hypothetical protein